MRAFKDDVFDALGFVGYSSELTEKQKTDIINYIKQNFIVSVDGRKKNLLLRRLLIYWIFQKYSKNILMKLVLEKHKESLLQDLY